MTEIVTQQDEMGCGVACIATLLGVSYKKALKLFQENEKAKTDGFLCKDLVDVLEAQGYQYEYKYIKPKIRNKIYNDGVIVFVKRSKRYPDGHYLLRKNNKWADPWINFQRNKNIEEAEAGFRKRLPGRPIYAVLPEDLLPQ